MHKMMLHAHKHAHHGNCSPLKGQRERERGNTCTLTFAIPLQSNPSKATAMRAVLEECAQCAGTWNLYFILQDNYRICQGFTRISCSTHLLKGMHQRKKGKKEEEVKSENQKLVGNCNWASIMHSLWTQSNMCIPKGCQRRLHQGDLGEMLCKLQGGNPEALKVLWLHEYSVDLWN